MSNQEQFDICVRAAAVLRIYPGAGLPGDVTTLLELMPSDFVELGKERRLPSGRIKAGAVNGWWLSSEQHVASKDLRHHLDWLLEKIRGKKTALHKLQAEDGVRMWVHCIWWASVNGIDGPSLEPSHMAVLAELNLQCQFDFKDYSAG